MSSAPRTVPRRSASANPDPRPQRRMNSRSDTAHLVSRLTGAPSIVVQAEERDAEEPTLGFTRALLRASVRAATQRAAPDADAPLQLITRPALSRHHMGLGCGHVAPPPLAKEKDWPMYVPCRACLAEHPTDLEIVFASIEDAGSHDLGRIGAALEVRRPW